ncbi:MAG: dienelactone hydrolase family protein [bacterium]
MKKVMTLLFLVLLVPTAHSEIVMKTVEYTHDGATFEGKVACDDAIEGRRPGILVIHQWKGLGGYEEMCIRKLAELGYVAFALDLYGKGTRATSSQEASALAGPLYRDRSVMRSRAAAGLKQLRLHPNVDPEKIAVIGYCFGGTCALELARSGADVLGTVSFHGGLETPNPGEANAIRGQVLVCHGADDPNVTWEQVEAFRKEMQDGGVRWEFVAYGCAVHAFTDPSAGNDPSRGAAYNETADRRSWDEMKRFFNEIF